jgi:uncharacterized protein (DUF2336 family)
MTSTAVLTEADVRALVRSPEAEDRAAAAHKLCRRMDEHPLTPEERAAAQDILRMMAADAALLVRRALAVTLKASPLVPREVALRLAEDVDSIALPLLAASPAFSDDDLISLVRSGSETRQTAIARRPALSLRLAGSLVEFGAEAAVAAVCANDRAALDARAFGRALDRFPRSETVQRAMAERTVLPLPIAERLVSLASEAVRQHLIERHALTPGTALAIAAGAGERATIALLEQAARARDLGGFCEHLHREGRLTPSLLLRGLASGHMAFFEHALAERAGLPHSRAWIMVHDAGPLGLKAICERAGLPNRLFAAFRAGVDVHRALMAEGRLGDRAQFQERMLERFLTYAPPTSRDDRVYLLDRLGELNRREEARAREAA